MRLVASVVLAAVAASGAQSQRPRIRFGPGVCGPIDPAYSRTATHTGGQVFPLATAEVSASSRMMESSFLQELLLWASGDGEQTYSIPVDSTVERVMFSGTFDTTGGSLTLIGPDGSIVQAREGVDDTTLNCGRIITADKPASGTWQARVVPSGRFWFVVHAKSGLSLTGAEFVEREPSSGGFVRIEGEPIAGSAPTMRVSVSSGLKDPAFELVSVDARPLQSIDLQPTDGEAFTGTLTMPAEPFRLLVTGLDERGNHAQRIWAGLFHGEHVEVIPPAEDEPIAAGSSTPVRFTIRNHGSAVRLALVSSNDRGQLVAVDPPLIELGAGDEGTATVLLTVPPESKPESRVSIRLTASVDGARGLGGFNSASKAFAVRSPY